MIPIHACCRWLVAYGMAPFYFPIYLSDKYCDLDVNELALSLQKLGIGLGIKYGCLVSTWEWARPYMYDDFVSVNALNFRNKCFHLYLNENYTKKHAKNIAKAIKGLENSL